MKNKVKQIAMMAILIALSLILSYVDSLIVLPLEFLELNLELLILPLFILFIK